MIMKGHLCHIEKKIYTENGAGFWAKMIPRRSDDDTFSFLEYIMYAQPSYQFPSLLGYFLSMYIWKGSIQVAQFGIEVNVKYFFFKRWIPENPGDIENLNTDNHNHFDRIIWGVFNKCV